MKDDPTTHDNRFCRHCDTMLGEEETTRYDMTGCDLCVSKCAVCEEKDFNDDMKEVFVYDGITWNKGFICEGCYADYKKWPEDFEEISEEDPYQPLSLFDTFFEVFNPQNLNYENN